MPIIRASQKNLLKVSKQSFSWEEKPNSNLEEMNELLLRYQVRLMIAKKRNSVLFWDSLSTTAKLCLTFLEFHQNEMELEIKYNKKFTNWLIL